MTERNPGSREHFFLRINNIIDGSSPQNQDSIIFAGPEGKEEKKSPTFQPEDQHTIEPASTWPVPPEDRVEKVKHRGEDNTIVEIKFGENEILKTI